MTKLFGLGPYPVAVPKKEPKPDPKRYCAIIFIGGGSSWCWAPTKEEAVKKAVKQTKLDWKSMYKFEKGQVMGVLVYDMKDHSGWYATGGGVFSKDTKERLEPVEILSVPV